MIRRNLERVLRERSKAAPVVTLTGPRQSGKTTLCRKVFRKLGYVSLEPVDVRDYARSDPRGFLEEYRTGAVIDEVQHAPDLLSYIHEEVDADPVPGRFVVTGSQNLDLLEQVSQSLAGRTTILNLLSLSLDEVGRFEDAPEDLWTTVWAGGYPRIYDRKLDASVWLSDYVTTYVQRDVRQVLNVVDLIAFTQFVRLCAGRTATEVNLSSLGSDAGVSHNTVREWLSVLETGFLCFRAPAWRTNIRKQEIKAPKLHFLDSGLVCNLLGIATPDQLLHHPLRGQIFESWVASEIYKARCHRGRVPRIFHYRDPRGAEVDVVCETAHGPVAVEVKSGATLSSDHFRSLERFAPDVDMTRVVVFGGDQETRRGPIRARSWRSIQAMDWS